MPTTASLRHPPTRTLLVLTLTTWLVLMPAPVTAKDRRPGLD